VKKKFGIVGLVAKREPEALAVAGELATPAVRPSSV
jgi:hypothetical protein